MAGMIPGTVLLAARTARSQAYLQALNAAGRHTESLLIYGRREQAQPVPDSVHKATTQAAAVHLPDLGLTLEDSAAMADWTVDTVDSNSLDAPELHAALRARAPKLIVFSGYPAQMVPAAIIAIAPVLHLHSGALPAFRGSTTLYYSLLAGEPPAVSALLVDGGIDSGKIVAMRHYPPPAPGIDIDYVYDGAIRADLLTRVLSVFADTGRLPETPALPDREECLYFIIHPVLKHLAMASLKPPSQ
jgi:methionyl-tRNA formyltransferase